MDFRKRASQPDRAPAIDLWRHTLNQIPSTFGRLVYISSLRDQNTGRYEHHGLFQMIGEAEADQALRESHGHTFSEWLAKDLAGQKADMDLYLSSFHVDKRTVIETWLRLAPYRNLTPTDVQVPERRLYLTDIETILELLKHEHDVALQDPDA
jgi:hypothetical protein